MAEQLGALPNYDIAWDFKQMFLARPDKTRDIVALVAYFIAIPAILYRAKRAPGLIPAALHTILQACAFTIRRISADVAVSVNTARAIQALLAISYVLLCFQLLLLKSEQLPVWPFSTRYASSRDFSSPRPIYANLRPNLGLFSPLVSAALIVSMVHTASLGEKDGRPLYLAFIILTFVFLGALLLFMMRWPWAEYIRDGMTGVFLLIMNALLWMPVIYLLVRYLHYDKTESWVRNSQSAFFALWVIPQSTVVLILFIRPIETWYPFNKSHWLSRPWKATQV